MKKTGFNYAYAPNVAVSHNPQWGRFYESMGQEDEWIEKYGQSFVKGLMDVGNGKINGVLGGAKHFFGDGASRFGANEGSASVINFKTYLKHNSPGYKGAIASSLGSVQISYGGANYIPSAYDSYLKLGYLRENLGFTGFTTTSYNELGREDNEFLPRTFYNVTEDEGYAMIVNGGTDMLMIGGGKIMMERILKHAKKAIEKGFVLEKRLDESVVRILSVKFALGLITKVNGEQN
jgi:beta-glucosidase